MFSPRKSFVGTATISGGALGLLAFWLVTHLSETTPFMPHRTCYLNNSGLIWLHVISDALIGLAYVAISATLAYLVARARREIPFHWMMLAFAVFIIACGGTHLMEVWTVWTPRYWLAGGLKAVTAFASVVTAILLPPLVPKILALLQAAHLSSERKVELEKANAELGLANERVRTLDQLKTNFFANVSHEFRTPLTLILGPVDRMLDGAHLPEATRHGLDGIRRNGLILLKHVNDLLDISRLEAGKMELKYSRIDLARRMRLVTAYFEAMAQERLVQLVVDAPESLVAEVDADKIERVLVNLISNSLKFAPEGGAVRCGVTLRDERVLVKIEDNGPGIPVELRETIFERFNQGDDSGRRTGGTGLGLSIVKEFVELHHGVVAVGDSPEGGAAFTIDLPLHAPAGTSVDDGLVPPRRPALAEEGPPEARSHDDQAESTWARQQQLGLNLPPARPDLAPGGVPTVLVVEDTREMNEFIVQILEGEFRVVSAFDGAEGLAMAFELRPDLIVTDMMMPVLGGEELLRRVRESPKLTGTPVLLLTAKADEVLKTNLLQTGAQDYVMKPFVVEELRTRVRNLVSGKLVRDMLQRELDSQTSDLGQLAHEITARTRQLQEAKETAEAANRAKDQFLAVLSHELRTPLSPVLTALADLEAGNGLPEQAHLTLQMIRRNVELEARLIDDLLDLTRVAKGKLQLHREPVDVHDLLRHALEICESEIAHKQMQVRREFGASAPFIQVDSGRTLQVLWNVIQNAVKFNGARGEIVLRTSNPTPELLRIEIADNGVGIEPEVLSKIFNAFEQGDNSVTRRFGGLGLGLALSRALVQAHGGTIEASSAGHDAGTTIRLEFAAVAAPAPGTLQKPPVAAVTDKKAARVLLVEDHEDTRTALFRLLGRWGYAVETAGSVAAGLELAREKQFDLLVSDLGLPDGTGADLIRTLRKTSGIPAIAISGFGMESDIENSRAAGFAEHLTKPVAAQTLKSAIERVLGAARGEV